MLTWFLRTYQSELILIPPPPKSTNVQCLSKSMYSLFFLVCNSPLSQILDKASVASPSQPAKENLDPEDGKSTAVENEELVKRRREKREELARLVQQGSGHTDLAAAEENLAEKKMLSRLEARDAIEEKLLAQHEQECQVVACLTVSLGLSKTGIDNII